MIDLVGLQTRQGSINCSVSADENLCDVAFNFINFTVLKIFGKINTI